MAVYIPTTDKKFIAVKPYNNHPDDRGVFIVMYINKMVASRSVHNEQVPEYVVHLYNSRENGMSSGFYSTSFSEAMANFNSRGTC
jgi:hypothetical protein